MKKIVINLKRREDRKQHFLEKNHFLNEVEFLGALDGKQLDRPTLVKLGFGTNKSWRDPYHNRKMTKGEAGCAISHMQAWRYCLQENEPVIIFEDDAIVDESRWDEKKFASLLEEHNLVYLAHLEQEDDPTIIDDEFVVPKYPYNLHAYIITPEAAHILLSTNFKNALIPVDDYVALMMNRLKPIAYSNNIVNQIPRDESPTDIEPLSEEDYFIDFEVHPLTVGTDRKKCIPLNDSGARMGIYPKNLGTNDTWYNSMEAPAGGRKINLLKEYIKTLPDNDVVLFTDAYDVFYADDITTIVQRYLSFNTRALFSAEQYIWPDESLADKFPEAPTKYRYLNSGTFIAEVGELKRILADEVQDSDDDQLYYQQKFLSGEFNIKLDYEGYIFITHEEEVRREGNQVYNPVTNTFGCIYHGNGGEEAKRKFDALFRAMFPKLPTLYLPTFDKFDILDKDMLVVDFMTQSQCEDLINIADKHGGWDSLTYDKFPAQEIRMKELGLWEELERHWQKNLYPIIERYWNPIEMYGLRDAFVMRYAMDTQTSLAYHHDASLVTGSVKLNDDYEGAELVYHRQGISNKDIPVGRAILFPGMVTHGHECMELKSGVKYSLTMWSKRFDSDHGG
jgi:GR25 family glycosyltransferase involved in LPS biosynthesis